MGKPTARAHNNPSRSPGKEQVTMLSPVRGSVSGARTRHDQAKGRKATRTRAGQV